MIADDKRAEFAELFQEFAETYPSTPEGQRHAALYEEGREQGRRNYEAIIQAKDRGEDVTDEVLLKLLPHADTGSNRERGAWIHIAPTVHGNVRQWFEGAGWTKAEEWRAVAEAILDLVRRCVDDPKVLAETCAEFAEGPYSKGLQAAMLTPILNALRPESFLVYNHKSRKVINYFRDQSCGAGLTDYPRANATGRALIEAAAGYMDQQTLTALRIEDRFDTFCHWLVAERKYSFTGPDTAVRYWKIAPGEGAWNWDACRENGYIAIGWDELGDVSGLSRAEFDARRDQLVAEHDDWTKVGANQVWRLAHIAEGDRVVANHGKTTVLGIGTVSGPYYFVANERHGHRLPVVWDDVTERVVDEYGWQRTLLKLDREKFQEIVNAPPVPEGDRAVPSRVCV